MKNLGYLGPKGTYSYFAANYYSEQTEKTSFNTINEVLNALITKKVNEVIVPLENSIHGSIVEVLDFFASENDFNIKDEIEIKINHSLFTIKGTNNRDIRIIFSHPQALGQCYKYLNQYFPSVELKASRSTTDSLNDLKHQNLPGGFIGPPWMKDMEDVQLLDENIQTTENNVTRFVVIGKKGLRKITGRDKTSFLISFYEDAPGSLYSAIEPLAKEEINMTKVESRPTKEKLGTYYFFIDVQGHVKDEKLNRCLKNMNSNVARLKIIGSYPRFERELN